MPSCRMVIAHALRQVRAMAPGDMAHIDQLNSGLPALQNVILEIHEARGPLVDVDVTASTYIPSENQRVRVQLGDTCTVTLPNAIPMYDNFDPYDYGFIPAQNQWGAFPPQGTTGSADNVLWRQPRDGARIELVGTISQLYFYRADINTWLPAYFLPLDEEIPFNARYAGPLGTMTAERLMEELSLNEPTPGFARRVANARALMFMRPGTTRSPTRGEYF